MGAKQKEGEAYERKRSHDPQHADRVPPSTWALFRAGVPLGSLTLALVRGRQEWEGLYLPVALDGTADRHALPGGSLGEVGWVRNLRAAGRAQLTRSPSHEGIGVVKLEVREAAHRFSSSFSRTITGAVIPPYWA